MTRPVPIGDSARRLPQAGRIRLGGKVMKHGKEIPVSFNTFHFTSQDRDLLVPVAQVHGGEIKAWSERKSPDAFELATKATKISVILPPNPLTEYYELWSGKHGLERRCDGVTCQKLMQGPDGGEVAEVPCICFAKDLQECDYKLRLSVMLPEVESIGTWRLDTKSENARLEIPEVVKTIELAQGRGLFHAVLRLERRTAPGKRFNVPVLDPGVSIETLVSGGTRLGSLPAAPQRELVAGEVGEEGSNAADSSPTSPSSLDDIEDAIVVDDVTGVHQVDPTIGKAFLDNLTTHQKNKALIRARNLALEMGEPVPTTLVACSDRLIDRLVTEWEKDGFNGDH